MAGLPPEPIPDQPALTLLTLSPRVAPGLLSAAAWRALAGADVRYAAAPGHVAQTAAALCDAGVTVTPAAVGDLPALAAAGPVVWLCGPDGDPAAESAAATVARITVRRLTGSRDLPGARLLDAVALMDRLRSPGGCPWDREQTHASLAGYLLEEAYEAHELLETGVVGAELADELGDVLLQVLFHARIAAERIDGPTGRDAAGWDIDTVATGLVAKLTRRHPHVFDGAGTATARPRSAAAQQEAWDELKAAEGRTSALDGVAFGQPALSLARKVQARAQRAGLDLDPPAGDGVGARLWAVVEQARTDGLDPEAELRAVVRGVAGQIRAAERRERPPAG